MSWSVTSGPTARAVPAQATRDAIPVVSFMAVSFVLVRPRAVDHRRGPPRPVYRPGPGRSNRIWCPSLAHELDIIRPGTRVVHARAPRSPQAPVVGLELAGQRLGVAQ